MSSFDRKKKEFSSESAPLLQRQQEKGAAISSLQPIITDSYDAAGVTGSAAAIPQQQYGTTGSNAGYASPGMPVPPPYDANNAMFAGSSYFIPPPGYYPIPPQQLQQSPVIVDSPNQPSHLVGGAAEGAVGMLPQPPFFYPFHPPEGGALPQYQYPIYPIQQQRQQQRTGPNNSTPLVNTISHSPTTSGSLPPLNDIFNAPGVKEGQSSGYGSLATSPKIYNAPISRLPPSGRTPQQQQTISRTNSSNDFKRMQKGSSTTKDHRRVQSDGFNRLRRRANTEEALPPRVNAAGHNRARTLSGGNPLTPRSRHRRAGSSNSYHSMGGGSYTGGSMADSSQVSMRSNIAKSSLFAGVDADGRPLLYYPYEAIRLVMIPDHRKGRGRENDDNSDEDTAEQEDHLPLTIGHLYADEPVIIEDYYEDYHRVSDELEQGITPQWESLDTHPLRKTKKSGSEGYLTEGDKQELLPPTNYIVAVSDDIYRRMFSEVADAQSMPCGLFFCGHHEDVDYPSVWIPATLVIILFGTLLYLSYITEG